MSIPPTGTASSISSNDVTVLGDVKWLPAVINVMTSQWQVSQLYQSECMLPYPAPDIKCCQPQPASPLLKPFPFNYWLSHVMSPKQSDHFLRANSTLKSPLSTTLCHLLSAPGAANRYNDKICVQDPGCCHQPIIAVQWGWRRLQVTGGACSEYCKTTA